MLVGKVWKITGLLVLVLATNVLSGPLRINMSGQIDMWNAALDTPIAAEIIVEDDISEYKEAMLLLLVDDIDAHAEAEFLFNDAKVSLPPSTVGEGVHCGAVSIPVNIIKPGSNSLTIIRKSTLDDTTEGFALLKAQLRLFSKLSLGDKLSLIQQAADPSIFYAGNEDGSLPEVKIPCHSTPWAAHVIKQGDGEGGVRLRSAQYRLLYVKEGKYVTPYGLAAMDNGEIALVGSWNDGLNEQAVIAFSSDKGETWSDFTKIPDVILGPSGRPMNLAYLGNGVLTFTTVKQHFSRDYGHTWTETGPGPDLGLEGNMLIDRDEKGNAVKVGVVGYNVEAMIRWSMDGSCREWSPKVEPKEWQYPDEYEGQVYNLGGSEGALVRATNGWVVVALRTDIPARFMKSLVNDGLEGTGISISRDDGETWSPVRVLFEAGRHHANLINLPNGDLLMTLVVRSDIDNGAPYGELATRRRGLDALISHDNGLTWNLDQRYTLDAFEYYDPQLWLEGQCGHLFSMVLDQEGTVLTVYANYLSKGITMLRWRPDGPVLSEEK